jgi:DNA adenine methylase
MIKSPLNYIGGKSKLLTQIIPRFPPQVETFVDLFAGGCTVGLNVRSKRTIFNDNLTYLVDLYQKLQELNTEEVFEHINKRIDTLGLSKTNEGAYLSLRSEYNTHKNPLDLFVLVAYSFNHQIRFNSNHQFNLPFGKNRSHFNKTMERNLRSFLKRIKEMDCTFSNVSFEDFDFSGLSGEDLVYCDPPYLITTGSYNDGKRGFKGWGHTEEGCLLDLLDSLSERGVRFALSNVVEHKGKENNLLKDWVGDKGYNLYPLNFDYKNSSYQGITKGETKEVLITNYPTTYSLLFF